VLLACSGVIGLWGIGFFAIDLQRSILEKIFRAEGLSGSQLNGALMKWSGYASIYFFDSNADGRQQSSETCRVSGKVDAVRLPKEIYFAHRVMQSEQPDIHILGHWAYPADTKKTVYVVSNAKSVELLLNGQSIGINSHPTDGFVFAFPDVHFQSGTLKAVGSNDGKVVCQHELTTAGPAATQPALPLARRVNAVPKDNAVTPAAGLTTAELAEILVKKFRSEYLKDPKVTVSIAEVRGF
jgi:hypothetical protein